MATEVPDVLTPDEIAEQIKTSVDDVVAELTAGRLRGFRVGNQWRVTIPELCAFMAGASSGGNGGKPMNPLSAGGGLDLGLLQWKQRAPFVYTWPDGKTQETYEPAYEADVPLPSGQRRFVIGYTCRTAAGMKDRRRVVVFLGEAPQLVPVVEFCGTNEHAKTGEIASVIKGRDNRHVRSQAQLPPEYNGMPTVIYSEVVVGPYAARSVAVLAKDDDRELMLRHAIIRAQYKGLIPE